MCSTFKYFIIHFADVLSLSSSIHQIHRNQSLSMTNKHQELTFLGGPDESFE